MSDKLPFVPPSPDMLMVFDLTSLQAEIEKLRDRIGHVAGSIQERAGVAQRLRALALSTSLKAADKETLLSAANMIEGRPASAQSEEEAKEP